MKMLVQPMKSDLITESMVENFLKLYNTFMDALMESDLILTFTLSDEEGHFIDSIDEIGIYDNGKRISKEIVDAPGNESHYFMKRIKITAGFKMSTIQKCIVEKNKTRYYLDQITVSRFITKEKHGKTSEYFEILDKYPVEPRILIDPTETDCLYVDLTYPLYDKELLINKFIERGTLV